MLVTFSAKSSSIVLKNEFEVYKNMRVVRCRHTGNVWCSEDVKGAIRGEELRVDLDEETLIIFETLPRVRVICSGLEYQFHQWGLDAYHLWLLNRGSNVCLFLEDVDLDEVSDKAILVKRRNEGSNIDHCIESYIKSLSWREGIIVLLSRSIRDHYCFKNIVSLSSLDHVSRCLEGLRSCEE